MHARCALVLLLLAGCNRGLRVVASGTVVTDDFEGSAAGDAPAGFESALTGPGAPSRWVIEAVDGAPSGRHVLAQVDADPTNARYPLCIRAAAAPARDVELSVRFNARSGEVDRAAGLVARYQGADDYYLTRANALEGNVRFYRVVGGKREQIASADVPVTSGEWHTLGLTVRGERFVVALDGRSLFAVEDRTIQAPGRVGLWTTADSVTWFDDFSVETWNPE